MKNTIPNTQYSIRYTLCAIFIAVLCLILPQPVQAAKTNQISQFGITWTFDKEYEYGQFANGDYWVVGPVTIVDIDPKSTDVNGRVMHGSMINPSAGSSVQGYDSHYYKNPPQYFDPNLNVARPGGNDLSALNPLVVPAGSSLISSISKSEPLVRPQLETAAILTVLSEAPPEGSFRPPYAGTDKTIKFNKNDLDNVYSLLGNIPRAGLGALTLAEVERYFERPWLDHIGPEEISRYHHPSSNMPNFGRDMAVQIGIGALMMQLDFTPEEKETLLIRMVQLGIDFYGIVENGGKELWTCAGGHSSGRKWPILFAGLVLDNPNAEVMKNIGEKSGDYRDDEGGNLKDPLPTDYIHFGEDDQTFYVVQSDVDRHHDLDYRGVPYSDYSYPYSTDYRQEHLGMPEWGIDHGDLSGGNNGPRRDTIQWDAAYRWNQNGAAWPGFILATRIMEETANAKTLWNHDALFDYEDRFMSIQKENNWNCGDYRRSWSCFVETMWDTYRANYGCVWTRDDPNDIYSNGHYVSCNQALIYGDVSGDGQITAYDAALTAQAAVDLITLTADQTKAAEVSGDGEVSAYDAALIAQKAVGLIEKFPVE